MLYKMKIALIAIILMVGAFNSTRAQVMIGPYIGANLSTVVGDSSSGNSWKPGLNLGIALDVGLSENFMIETGLGYNMKGTSFDNKGTYSVLGFDYTYENTGHTTYSYLSIPVLLMAKSGNFFFQVGPDFSALVAANSKYTSTRTANGTTTSTDTSYSSTSDLHTIDYGLNVAIGAQSKEGAFIRLGSVIGFGNIDNASTNNLKAHNLLFQLSIGYKFGSEGKND